MSEPSILRKLYKFDPMGANNLKLTLGYGDGQPGGATVVLGSQQETIPGPADLSLSLVEVELPAVLSILALVKDTQNEHNHTSMVITLDRLDDSEAFQRAISCEAPEDDGEVMYDIKFLIKKKRSQ